MTGTHRILIGDVLTGLATLPDASVHCCITSPPYWGLRDYGVEGQIGLEPTPDAYVARMVAVFRAVRRVLRDDGTCWVNLGDSYNAYNGNRGPSTSFSAATEDARPDLPGGHGLSCKSLKPKDLVGIPWRVAFALQADGWYLRSDIIWAKCNPMPESVTDRPTKAHEYLFLLSKSERYWYDAEAIKEPDSGYVRERADEYESWAPPGQNGHGGLHRCGEGGRNRRTVWTIATQAFPEAHFATFPEKLVEPCVLAGCPDRCCPKCGAGWERVMERTAMVIERSERTHTKGRTRASGTMLEPPRSDTLGFRPACTCGGIESVPGTVLDPFSGSGTTGAVACPLGRHYIGCELNHEYAAMSERRIGRAVRPGTFRSDTVSNAELFAEVEP